MHKRLLPLCILFLLVFANVGITFGATITVCSSGCNHTTIQAAVNAASNGDTIHINVNGAHTENNITVAGKDLNFKGNGMNTTIIQGHANRLSASERIIQFARTTTAANPDPPIAASFRDLSLRHGYASLTSPAVNAAFGGAIFFGNGGGSSLGLLNVKIYNNDTRSTTGSNGGGVGLYMSSGNGAGIYTTINNCIFDDNNTGTSCTNSSGCGQQAGGIYASGNGSLTINNSTITNNTAFTAGAAIYSGSGGMLLAISNTLFEGNNVTEPNISAGAGSSFSGAGGAIYIRGNQGTITNCLFKNNSAATIGGAVVCGSRSVPAAPIIFTNCTFNGNSAPRGGAIYRTINGTDPVEPSMFINCTVYNNSSTIEGKGIHVGSHNSTSGQAACRIGLINCIVAGNTGTGSDLYFLTNYDRLVVNQKNYIGTHSAVAGTAPTFDFTSSNSTLGLSALANNGGPTETMALTLSSTLRNVGVNSYSGYTIPTVDQRNFNRNDGLTDLGAFEYVTACSVDASSGTQNNVACNGGSTGSATVTPTGGTTPYSYAWSAGGSITATASNLAAGTYTVTVTDAGSCTATKSFTITQPTSALTLTSAGSTNVSCNGGSNGAASVNAATGGTGTITYDWTPGTPTGDGTVSVTGLSANSYTVVATDANSCTKSVSFNITQPSAIVLTAASTTTVSCNGGSNGAASVNAATGGTGTITYDWTPGTPTGDGTVSITGLSANSYTVVATDANSCTKSVSFNVTQPSAIVLTAASTTTVSCNGGSNGAASVNAATGGTGTITYDWTPGTPTGDGTVSITGLAANTYTVVATDANSCTKSVSFNITQPSALVLTAASTTTVSCNGGSNGAASVNAATGGTGTITYDWTPGTPTGDGTVSITGLSANTYTVVATDANSCTKSVSFNITQPSALVLTPGSTQASCAGNDGTASVSVSGGTPTYDYLWSNGGITATITGLAPGTYTVTVTDGNSCTSVQTATVGSSDVTPPVASSKDITVYLAANGTITVAGADVNDGSTDNCGNLSYSVSPGTFTCANIGSNAYTLTVTDGGSNTAIATGTITVLDTTSPAAVAQNITLPLDATGNVTLTASMVNNGSNDACGIASISVSPNTFDCTNLGNNTVTLTVVDINSNSSTTTATVLITDTVKPDAQCQNITLYLDATGNTSTTATAINNGSSDACSGVASLGLSQSAFTCADQGTNNVTLTVTDNSGNSATCVAVVTVIDTIAPVLTCPSDISATNNVGICGAVVTYTLPAYTDNCLSSNTLTQIAGLASGSTFPVGNTVNTFVVTDGGGYADTCSFNVTITDTSAPVAFCQNITVQLDNTGNVTIAAADVNNGSTDNCGIEKMTVSPGTFDCTNLGSNTVTLTVTDTAGNSATCTATVTVQDTVKPVASCQNITVYLDASGNVSITAAQVDNGSNDVCSGIASVSVFPTSFACGDTGVNNVVLTVTDNGGNSTTCNAIVTVQDTIAPVVVCTSDIVVSNETGNCGATVNYTVPTTSDNCAASVSGNVTMPAQSSPFTGNVRGYYFTAPVSFNITGLYIPTDASSATQNLMVIKMATVPPLYSTTTGYSSLEYYGNNLPATGFIPVNIPVVAGEVIGILGQRGTTTSYASAPSTIVIDGNNVSIARLGTQYTINSMAAPQGSFWTENGGSLGRIEFQYSIGSPVNVSQVAGLPSGSIFPGGTTVNTFVATDASGNTDTCSFLVTVNDTTKPVAVCKDITVTLDNTGNIIVDGRDIDNGSTDNCGIASFIATPNAFNCNNVGANTVTLTVTDTAGNSSTCTAIVTVNQTLVIDSVVATSNYNGYNVSCLGGSDGTATVYVTSSLPLNYQWSNGDNTQTATNLSATTYSVTVTTGGCADTAFVTLNEPPTAVSATAVVVSNYNGREVSCFGASDGILSGSGAGGIGALQYAWNTTPVQNNDSAINVPSGTYTLTVTDDNGCTATATDVVDDPPLLVSTATATTNFNGFNISCNGGNDGAVQLTTTGGTGTYTYVWPSGANTGNTTLANALRAGTYVVTVTDINGCTDTASVTLAEPTIIALSLASFNPTCGASNGSVVATATGGAGAYTYNWNTSPAQTTDTASGLTSGTYVVTVTDVNGCTATNTATLFGTNNLQVQAVVNRNVSCNAGKDGSAQIIANGGTQPYTYSWPVSTGIGNESQVDTLAAGTYTVTVADANGCSATTTINITEPTQLNVSAAVTSNYNGAQISCNGALDGAITATATGGSPSYTYSWSSTPVQTGATATGLAAGTYTVTITDAKGCTAIASATLAEPDALVVSSSVTSNYNGSAISCFGSADGTATVTATNGTGNYNFAWPVATGVGNTANGTGLSAGVYQITVSDANGCTATTAITVTQPAQLTVSTTKTDVSCYGGNDGTATVSATGGIATYTYNWNTSPAQNTATASGLATGAYTVIVTDVNGCTASASATIAEPSLLITQATTSNNVSCFGGSNGSGSVFATGGTPIYSYSWPVSTGVGNSASGSGLAAGTYVITVTDSKNCTSTSTLVITEPTQLGTTTAVTSNYNGAQISCNGALDGAITATATGGSPNYSYTWSSNPVQTGATATGLAAGTYTVTVSDANGCTAVSSSTLTNPNALVVGGSVTSNFNGFGVSCFGSADGTSAITVTGGTGAYNYAWPVTTGVGNTANGTGLSAGVYQVTVSDANGCTAATTITVTQPTRLSATTTKTDVSCYAGNDGTATVTANGGVASYAYSWSTSPAQTTATASGLAKGTYIVTVTDVNGCTATASATIGEPSLLISQSTNTNNVSCFGGNNGSGSVFATGGTSPYSYGWPVSTGVGNSATGSGLSAGTYVITVTDSKGCTSTSTLVITQPTLLVATSVVISNYNGSQISCKNASDGTLQASATGGTAPYSYVWGTSPVQSGIVANNVDSGSYTVTVTDINNCTAVSTVTITDPTIVDATGTVTSNYNGYSVSCFGSNNGSASVAATGGTGAYTYVWPTAAGTGNVNTSTTLPAGNYAVTVKDANQCFDTATLILTEPTLLTASTNVTDVKCFGGNDGKAWVTGTGGVPAYSYTWNTTPAQTTDTASALTAGTYAVTITDLNGCTVAATAVVNEPTLLVVSVAGENVTCPGGNDGKAVATVTGGTLAYSYLWSTTPAQTTATATQLVEGTYTVTVTDANGCTETDTAEIEVKYPVLPTATVTGGDTICAGQPLPNISIELTGYAPYTFVLHNGSTTKLYTGVTTSPFVISNAGAGTYYVTAFSDAHCTGLTYDTVEVLINPIPEVFVSGGGNVCDGDKLPTILVDLTGDANWSIDMDWANGRDTTVTGVSSSPYTIEPTEEGTYTVKAVTDGNGCKAFNLNASASVGYYLLPLVDAGEPKSVDKGFSVKLDGKVITAYGGFVTYDWTPDSTLDNATLEQPTARPFETTLYTFTATDKNGCKASDTVTVSVTNRTVIDVINIFTPDDDGINEFFVIRNLDAYPSIELTIVNRWGNIIYQTNSYHNDWDGTWKGKPADDGTYYYIIKEPVSGATTEGPVTILRKQ